MNGLESVTLFFVLSGCYPQEGLTALMLATMQGYARAVKILLVGKADPNITVKVYCCSLHVWIMYYCALCVCTDLWVDGYLLCCRTGQLGNN